MQVVVVYNASVTTTSGAGTHVYTISRAGPRREQRDAMSSLDTDPPLLVVSLRYLIDANRGTVGLLLNRSPR